MTARPVRRKHIPQRMCVVCRQKWDKRALTRIVRTPDAGVVIDPTGKRNGRGAYLCTQATCWDKAVHKQALDKALQIELTTEEREAILAAAPHSE